MKHGVPYIIDAHGSTVDLNGTKQIVRKLYDKIIGYKTLANAGKLIAETEIGVSEYKKLGVDEHKIALLHPFLDTSEFSDLPPKGLFKYMHRIDGKLVIFLGRIHRNKGIDILVKAIAQLPDVVLAVVGQNDGFMDTLDILILEQGIRNRVLFTGYLGGRDKLSAIVDADVLIQHSMNEAGARPSLEAILCGTPIIVTKNTGAGKEISKFDGGYLVDYGDVEGLTQAIKHILYNNGEAWIKTHKARAYIQENLSLESQIVKYEELYRSVI
jgi:glycosyltransferase involved in cell wall biosynthesis